MHRRRHGDGHLMIHRAIFTRRWPVTDVFRCPSIASSLAAGLVREYLVSVFILGFSLRDLLYFRSDFNSIKALAVPQSSVSFSFRFQFILLDLLT